LKKQLADSRAKLLAARDQRVRPGKDDKILVSWNALMIDALAKADISGNLISAAPDTFDQLMHQLYSAKQARYLRAACYAADFVLRQLTRDGRLLHTWRNGQAKLAAYLDDYAYLINALVTLYEATFDEKWLHFAVCLTEEQLLKHFYDSQRGGFFFTADDHEQLIARNKDLHDASVPSGNAMAATALIRLGKLTGRTDFLDAAGRTLAAARHVMVRMPTAAGQMLIALDMWQGPFSELVLVGGSDDRQNLDAIIALRGGYLPNCVLAYRPAHDDPNDHSTIRSAWLNGLFESRTAIDNQPTLYICQNFTCQAPIAGVAQIQSAIANL